MDRKARGFTLIELLVVVAIIALLIAILLPSLARAKERAKTVLCASNMRSAGQIVMLFAAEHDNRCPGGASRASDGSSYSWVDILNGEGLQNTSGKYDVDMRGGVSYQTLSCPNFIQGIATTANPGGASIREMEFNANAVSTTNGVVFTSQQMAAINYFYSAPIFDMTGGLLTYNLGARVDRFRADEYMIIETFAGNDEISTIIGNSKGQALTLGNSSFGGAGGYFVYSGNRDGPQFRHPWGQGANFLCFDDHVQFQKPGDGNILDLPNVGTTGYSHMNILP